MFFVDINGPTKEVNSFGIALPSWDVVAWDESQYGCVFTQQC